MSSGPEQIKITEPKFMNPIVRRRMRQGVEYDRFVTLNVGRHEEAYIPSLDLGLIRFIQQQLKSLEGNNSPYASQRIETLQSLSLEGFLYHAQRWASEKIFGTEI